jgi:DNA repair photolyase
MPKIRGTEQVINPLQESALNKKGLCDYVVNVASGCLHGCTFCYVPSTPVIRARQAHFKEHGVNDPQMDWGNYLLIRDNIPEQLEDRLSRKRSWRETPSGKGVVLLCSGTDPYQNSQTARVTRNAVKVLLEHGKRVRILTRSPLWLKDLDILTHQNVTIGMSLPYLDDDLSRQIEPQAPPPTKRYAALLEGLKQGCRLYVAVAPTPPQINMKKFISHLSLIRDLNPEVIFWEPINARGSNGKRMTAAGLEFAASVMGKDAWADYFVRQWEEIEEAAEKVDCIDRLHIWADSDLEGYVPQSVLEYWWYRPTVEKWEGSDGKEKDAPKRPLLRQYQQLSFETIESGE